MVRAADLRADSIYVGREHRQEVRQQEIYTPELVGGNFVRRDLSDTIFTISHQVKEKGAQKSRTPLLFFVAQSNSARLSRHETMREVFRPVFSAPPAFSFPQGLTGAVKVEPDEPAALALDDSVQRGYWADPLADDHSSPVVRLDDCSEPADSAAAGCWTGLPADDRSSQVAQRDDYSESAGWAASDSALADCSVEADWVEVDSVEADCWAAPEWLLDDWPADSRADRLAGS